VVTKAFCDRCGKEIGYVSCRLADFSVSVYDKDGESTRDFEADLCHTCTKEIEKWARPKPKQRRRK